MMIFRLLRFWRKARNSKLLGVATVGLLLFVAIMGNAICFYTFDGHENPEIGFGESVWYSVISVTTIGYGDYSASTLGARIGTVIFIILAGLTAYSLFFGLAIDWITDFAVKGRLGMSAVYLKNHTIIVHFPGESRVNQLIDEIKAEEKDAEIVIVSDQLEKLPFDRRKVFFVRGSTLSEEVYRKANVECANKAIVLARSYEDANSDAVVASAVSVMDHMNDRLHIVAECVSEDHKRLFQSVRTNAIISGLKMTGNLLVQESVDPGVGQVIDVITSNQVGDTMFSAKVEESVDISYADFAKLLLDEDVNVLAVNRGEQTFTAFREVKPEIGDRIVYLSRQRMLWNDLMNKCENSRVGAL
ncbi:NAD-binding protein [Planctomycetota bacterium]|nr:NAD-binding protein [Planctomycetota bacterium]